MKPVIDLRRVRLELFAACLSDMISGGLLQFVERCFRGVALRSTVALALLASSISAQVPQIINFQGRVIVGSVNFSGTGQFKFALVDPSGSVAYWSNDGSSSAGGQPAASVNLAVTNGLYSLGLGDTALAGMTSISPATFLNSDVRLRVRFNDGIHGFQQMSPDVRITSVGYAMVAATVPNGSITGAQIANGAIGTAQIAPGAITVADLSPGVALPSGGLIASPDYLDPALISAGYSTFGGPQVSGDLWTRYSSVGEPAGRTTPINGAVWTGTEMIFWGDIQNPNGARFNPQSQTWISLLQSAPNAPSPRTNYLCVWTGTEMIIWGGGATSLNGVYDSSAKIRSGSRYNPLTDKWTPMSDPATFIPGFAGRDWATAVWTGSLMIVWGGQDNTGTQLKTGARYDPVTDTWSPTKADATAPSARADHTAVWTGNAMIVWGGGAYDSDGSSYDPLTDTWTPIAPSTSAISGRAYAASTWAGSKMFVWGGYLPHHTELSDGALYDPASNSWTRLPDVSLGGRHDPKIVWTGNEVLLYGGDHVDNGPYADGAAYDPATKSWKLFSTVGAPSARDYFPAVWDGRELLVCNYTTPADIFGYAPSRAYYLYRKP